MRGAAGKIVLTSLLALGVCASTASAEPLSMTFTESRANVGVQLSDAALFEAPDTAPLAAEIDPGTGAITAGTLTVPDFTTHITDPLDADVTVDFDIGTITGSFDPGTGALTLSGTAGGTLTANGKNCIVATVPSNLTLSTAGNSGGTNPRTGTTFADGLDEGGAIAGQWTDMTATPVTFEDTTACETVDERIGGPGGIWLVQEDFVAPPPPQLTSTDPSSPSVSGTPRIVGAAEAGSTVSIYAGPACGGAPVATGNAAELSSPGILVGEVAEGVTAEFSATAADAADNTSDCSAPIAYTRAKAPDPDEGGPDAGDGGPTPTLACIVPKLVGKTLPRAKKALRRAGCKLGKVRKPQRRIAKRRKKGKRPPRLVVKSSSPRAGARVASGKVSLRLGPKRTKTHRAR